MGRLRLVAAVAAMITALLVQGAVVGPASAPLPVALPAVLVAAVALVDGAGTGLAFGFVCGLAADLLSDHPAGVLALVWLGLGLLAGRLRGRRRWWADALLAGVLCGLAGLGSGILLAITHSGATVPATLRDLAPATSIELALAVAVVPLARLFLHTEALRVPEPVLTELHVGAGRG